MKYKWLSGQGYVHVTLMTWVQIPGLANSNIIFQYRFLCNTSVKDYHIPSRSGHTHVHPIQINGQDSKNAVSTSQRITPNSKGQRIQS